MSLLVLLLPKGTAEGMVKLATVFVVAASIAGCSGRSAVPTAPAPVAAAGVPIVRAVTVDRMSVEAGSEVLLTATLDETIAPASFRLVWSVAPPAGTLTDNGPTARWRSPASDPVPALYVFSVTAIEATGANAATGANGGSQSGVTSPAVTVNDARRETQAHAAAFLSDIADGSVSPQLCVRNFTEACDGKRTALNDVTALRGQYSAAETSYSLQFFLRSIEWANCTGQDGAATCALLVYRVDTVWTKRSGDGSDRTHGYQYLRAVYERNRWWLCSSRFEENSNAVASQR